MAATSELDRVSMVVLRYMRGPVFVLIVVYAIRLWRFHFSMVRAIMKPPIKRTMVLLK